MVWDAQLNGDLVYADLDTGGGEEGRHVIVSLRSSRVLASTDASMPFLLLGEEINTASARPALLGRLGRRGGNSRRRGRTVELGGRAGVGELLGLVAGAVGLGRLAAQSVQWEPWAT